MSSGLLHVLWLLSLWCFPQTVSSFRARTPSKTGIGIRSISTLSTSPLPTSFGYCHYHQHYHHDGNNPKFRRGSLFLSNTNNKDDTPSQSLPSSFDWTTEWYPVIPLQDLDQTRPQKITLLGQDFVVWYHVPSQSWKAFVDCCPHRLVPLSEGRIEKTTTDYTLQCAYHGWQFNDQGQCTNIPQQITTTNDSHNNDKKRTNDRACVTSFPVQVAQELLWIFPNASKDAALVSQIKQPALIPELDDPTMIDGTNFFMRDMPYPWDILVENLCDPAHVPFAHHSFIRGANRNDIMMLSQQQNATDNIDNPSDFTVTEATPQGFRAIKGRQVKKNDDEEDDDTPAPYEFTFTAPCLLYSKISNTKAFFQKEPANKGGEDKKSDTTPETTTTTTTTTTNTTTAKTTSNSGGNFIGLGQYCIPTAPGQCRLIARFPLRIPSPVAMRILEKTPRWVTHFSQNIVMDSDVVFLCQQDETIHQKLLQQQRNTKHHFASPTSPITSQYYLPTKADAMVIAFRKWMYQNGKGPGRREPDWLGIPTTTNSLATLASMHSFSRSKPTTKMMKTLGGDSMGWIRPQWIPAREGRDALLDRYRQHTDICSSCRKAHERLYRIRAMLNTFGVLLLGSCCSIIAATATTTALTSSSSSSVAAAAASAATSPSSSSKPLVLLSWLSKTIIRIITSRQLLVVASCLGVACLILPKLVLQPIISRMECVPWPRKQWVQPPSSPAP